MMAEGDDVPNNVVLLQESNLGIPFAEERRIEPSLDTKLENPNDACINEFLNAIDSGDLELAKRIHKKKEFDIGTASGGSWGKYAVHFAAQSGNMECLKYLLDNKVPLDVKENRRKTALHIAVSGGHMEFVKLLLQAGTPLDSIDKFGKTPLMWAIVGGHEDIFQELLRAGAKVTAQGQDKWNALHEACKAGSVNMVNTLLNAGSSVNCPHTFSGCAPWSPLHISVRHGSIQCVKLLLENGAEVDSSNAGGHTPLHEAAYRGYTDIMFELLNRGANPNARSNQKRTPLHEACLQRKVNAAALLLDSCSWVNARDLVDETPLHLSLRGNYDQVHDHNHLRQLLHDNQQLVHNPHQLRQLLDGNHPSHNNNAADLTTLLLQYGASATMLGKDNEMPIQIAQATRQSTCLKLLQNSLECPRSLVILCKILIRKSLGCRMHWNAASLLPIPHNLKQFISEIPSS